jgi:hypothetical protein
VSVSSPGRPEPVTPVRGESSPPPAPAPPEDATCPRCSAPYEPGQEYCLECGLRLPLRRGVMATLETRWRRRLRWYPGDWIWPALLFLLLAAAGAAAAALYTRGGEPAPRTIVATTPPGAPPATTAGATETVPTATQTGATTSPGTTTSPPAAPSPSTPRATAIDWPTGKVGWTIVLRSIPVEDGRPKATSEAKKALAAGLTDVGVLDSSDYASLHPRYYVVFTGVYDSREDAEGALGEVQGKGYGGAYTRQVAP